MKPGFGRILLQKKNVAEIAGVKPGTWSNWSRKRNKVFLRGHHEFELLVLATAIEWRNASLGFVSSTLRDTRISLVGSP